MDEEDLHSEVEDALSKLSKEIKEFNYQYLRELADEFGRDVIDQMLFESSAYFKKGVIEGSVLLSSFEINLRSWAHQITYMRELYKVKKEQWAAVKQLTASALRNNQLDNKALIKSLKKKYSKEIVSKLLDSLLSSKREAIKQGSVALSQYADILDKKCELWTLKSVVHNRVLKKQAVGELPNLEGLGKFFKDAKITKYFFGLQGAFFFTVADVNYVVKPVMNPKGEIFANYFFLYGGIKTPDSRVVPIKSGIGRAITKKIEEYKEKEKPSIEIPNSKFYMIMTEIIGVALDKITPGILDYTLKEDPKSLEQILLDVGYIGAYDLFIYYQDRLSLLGPVNYDNIILLVEGNKFSGAAAIDQEAKLEEIAPKNAMMYYDPFATIEMVIGEIIEHGELTSRGAISIWLGFIESIHERIDRTRGLTIIQRGLMKGIREIAALHEEDLNLIFEESTKIFNVKGDEVDLSAYQKMLVIFQQVLFSAEIH